MLKLFAGRLATNFRKQFVSLGSPQLMIKLFPGRLATNFRKQFVSRRTQQFSAQTVSWPTIDEFSQTVCLMKDPAIQCSNCLLADWRRILANSLSREGPRNYMHKQFAGRQATNFRKQFVS